MKHSPLFIYALQIQRRIEDYHIRRLYSTIIKATVIPASA